MCTEHLVSSRVTFYVYPEIAKQMNRPRTIEWYNQFSGKLVQKIDPEAMLAIIETEDGRTIELPYWRQPPEANAWAYTNCPYLEFWTCNVNFVTHTSPNYT